MASSDPTIPPTLLYTEALKLVDEPPQQQYSAGTTLNSTMLPNSSTLSMYQNFYPKFEENSSLLNR